MSESPRASQWAIFAVSKSVAAPVRDFSHSFEIKFSIQPGAMAEWRSIMEEYGEGIAVVGQISHAELR